MRYSDWECSESNENSKAVRRMSAWSAAPAATSPVNRFQRVRDQPTFPHGRGHAITVHALGRAAPSRHAPAPATVSRRPSLHRFAISTRRPTICDPSAVNGHRSLSRPRRFLITQRPPTTWRRS
eukprot:3492510-Rhodomonas_salina.1